MLNVHFVLGTQLGKRSLSLFLEPFPLPRPSWVPRDLMMTVPALAKATINEFAVKHHERIKSQMAQELWCFKSKWQEKATVYPDSHLCGWNAKWSGDLGKRHLYACSVHVASMYMLHVGREDNRDSSFRCLLIPERLLGAGQVIMWHWGEKWVIKTKYCLPIFSSGRLVDELIFTTHLLCADQHTITRIYIIRPSTNHLLCADQYPVSHMYYLIQPSQNLCRFCP